MQANAFVRGGRGQGPAPYMRKPMWDPLASSYSCSTRLRVASETRARVKITPREKGEGDSRARSRFARSALLSLRKNGHFSYSSAVRTTLTQSIGTNPYRYKARQQSYVCSDRSIQKWLALSKDSCLKVFSVVHVSVVEAGQTDTKGSHQEMLFLVIQSMQEEDDIIGGKFGLSWKIRIAQKSEDGGVPSRSLNCSIFLEVCHTLGWTGLSDEFPFSLTYLNLLCLGVQSESADVRQIFPHKIKKKWYQLQLTEDMYEDGGVPL